MHALKQWMPETQLPCSDNSGTGIRLQVPGNPAPGDCWHAEDTVPLVIDCLNCEQGCNCGPASLNSDHGIDAIEQTIQRRHEELEGTAIANRRKTASSELTRMLQEYWEDGGYTRQYRDLSANNTASCPNHEQRAAILRSMHKYSEKEQFNCCSCGYGSCDDMAAAIHNGMNRPENCHHYLANETRTLPPPTLAVSRSTYCGT